MCHIFLNLSVFGNQKCALKNVKSALFLFSAPCPFLSLGGNSNQYKMNGWTIYIIHINITLNFCTNKWETMCISIWWGTETNLCQLVFEKCVFACVCTHWFSHAYCLSYLINLLYPFRYWILGLIIKKIFSVIQKFYSLVKLLS